MQWQCRCGAFAAEVTTKGGTRAVCYCTYCRDFAEKTNAHEILDEQGGSDLFQVAPENMVILRGAEHLAWTKLSDKGPARWFTTCCTTPVANTLETPKIPFVTLQTALFENLQEIPPVAVRVFRRSALGRIPDDGKGGVGRLYRQFALRALKSLVTGGWRRNPFFGSDGQMISQRQRLPD